jgi:nicotinamide-nucleotide amidase
MNEDHELVREAGELLTDAGAMVAAAESCTGGLLSSMLTNVPGSSAYFERGAVTYSNEAKVDLLGVDPAVLEREGAVSAPVARQMARGVMESGGTAYGVSTTGIAGPSGGTPEKPVGTVFIGVARGGSVSATRYEFDGSRLERKEQFAHQALRDLIDAVEPGRR